MAVDHKFQVQVLAEAFEVDIMIEVPSKGIYEINQKGNELKLIYTSKEAAETALFQMQKEAGKRINELFPDGIF